MTVTTAIREHRKAVSAPYDVEVKALEKVCKTQARTTREALAQLEYVARCLSARDCGVEDWSDFSLNDWIERTRKFA